MYRRGLVPTTHDCRIVFRDVLNQTCDWVDFYYKLYNLLALLNFPTDDIRYRRRCFILIC